LWAVEGVVVVRGVGWRLAETLPDAAHDTWLVIVSYLTVWDL
jgi:hypothetical protein